jgi:hypothetical protein
MNDKVSTRHRQKDRVYKDAEWKLLRKVEWIELDPPQMNHYLPGKQRTSVKSSH